MRGSTLMIAGLLAILSAASSADQAPVKVGLDRVQVGEVSLPRDVRAGLIAHAASITADGRHAIDVLRESGVNVVRLFAPEHGLRSRAAAGEQVSDGRDSRSGLPVVSLYGESRKPTPEQLADLDLLIFDLQGAGVRFYTYVSTLILSLEAAADAGVELIVLDRPNPLGGDRIEGPVSAPRELVPASFVNMAPGPLVHGLTLGEMARYVNSRRAEPARLRVISMRGWRRSMLWADTGREWVPPSPNLRTPIAALAYPGVALLEATNVSEGRGTESPFLLFGAPWFDAARSGLTAGGSPLAGFRLHPAEFRPMAGEAALDPKYAGERCKGFQVRVFDASEAAGYRLGLELVSVLARQEGFAWLRGGDALTWLLGTATVYEALAARRPVAEILAADEADHERWRSERGEALLY